MLTSTLFQVLEGALTNVHLGLVCVNMITGTCLSTEHCLYF